MQNNYMNPRMMLNNRGQQPQQPNGLRNDYQSVVQGIQSLMGISFSTVQLCIFGQMLMEKTKKLLEFIKSGAVTSINKFLTLLRIKQLLKGELTMTQIDWQVMDNCYTIAFVNWYSQIKYAVILLIGALLAYMKRKIKEKQETEAQNQSDNEDTNNEEAEEQQQIDIQADSTQLPIQQNDFWNHIEENPSNQEQQTQQQQQSTPVPSINYLNDLPGFSNSGNPSKPWMK